MAELSALHVLSLLFLTQYHQIGPVTPVREPRPKDEKELAQSHILVRSRVSAQADPPLQPTHVSPSVFSLCQHSAPWSPQAGKVTEGSGKHGGRWMTEQNAFPNPGFSREALPWPFLNEKRLNSVLFS